MICTFFGHRDTPEAIEPILYATLVDLIENKNVDSFYVGNHGMFDSLVRKVLKQLKFSYPHINYAVVLAYMPSKSATSIFKDISETVYPEGVEKIPPKYAIIERNRWMTDRSDYIVTYAKYTIGGAVKFKSLAEKKGKIVLNLSDFNKPF